MEKFYSRIESGVLLHLVYRLADVEGRTNIVPDDEFLQLASMRLKKDQTFKAHKHVTLEKKTTLTQESWLVVKGSVKCLLYDLDDNIIAEPVLYPGDCSITFRGGHNYLILENDTIVYEYKTGPYLGQKLDKVFLE
jgi:hypothetical protein